jgi:putative flippase GtrA
MNKFITFQDKDKRFVRQILIFTMITLVGLGISQLFVWGGDVLLGSDLIGKILGVGGTVIWNFSANRLITFRKRPDLEHKPT